jgi:hypothetical protein
MSHNTGRIEFNANVTVCKTNGEEITLPTTLYVHLKGFQGARSTHLDLANSTIINMLKLRRGGIYALMNNNGDVIEIYVSKQDSNLIGITKLKIKSTLFSNLRTTEIGEWIWIGVKGGNLIINLKKEHTRAIENIIKEKYPLAIDELIK